MHLTPYVSPVHLPGTPPDLVAYNAALGAARQAAAVHAGADDLSEWISSNHDAPIELAVEPNRDHVVIDAYESAYQRFRERGGALFAQ